MNNHELYFVVKGVVSIAPGRVTVIGRCGDLPIPVHQAFDRIFQYEPLHLPTDSWKSPIRQAERDVMLRVVCVHAYERSLPELGEGMTGSLVLEGEGADLVAPGWILGTTDERLLSTPSSILVGDQTAVH